MIRALLVLATLLVSSFSPGQNSLILIQHDQAGPNLPSPDYIHAEWIRWPADQGAPNNRILALACGVDLRGELADTDFALADGGWIAKNEASLASRGFFGARRAYLGDVSTTVIEKAHGGVSRSLFLLALAREGQKAKTQPFDAPLPENGLALYEAKEWNDAMLVARRTPGRALIVEYPPAGSDGWSRYWLYGQAGWPSGVPVESGLDVPGLVHARRTLALLLMPTEFSWRSNDTGRWGGANRWLEHGRDTSPVVLLLWFGGGVFVLAWALAQVMNEDRGPFVSELLVWVALSPAALLLTGAAGRAGGLEAWPIVFALAASALYGASALLGILGRRLDAHPLWAPSVTGLAVTAFCHPLWSDFSNRFGGLETAVPGDALGAFVAYLTAAAAFARGRWFGRAAVGAVLLWGVTTRPWWVDGHAALLILPAAGLVASEGLFRAPILALLALLPTGLLTIARDGFAWNQDGLIAVSGDEARFDLWRAMLLIGSPSWLGLTLTVALGLLIGNRFLAYRLRKLLRLDPRLRALPWTAAATLALSMTEPLAFPAVPLLTFAALLTLAYDGLRANA